MHSKYAYPIACVLVAAPLVAFAALLLLRNTR